MRELFVDTPVGRLRAVASGPSGPGAALICWPGLGLTALEFHRLLREGDERGVRVVAVDPPGHGRSDPAPHITFADMPAILGRVACCLPQGPRVLVGHSAGATALLFGAGALPDVAGIVLADGAFHEGAMAGDDGAIRRDMEKWMEGMTFPGWAACLDDARHDLASWDGDVEAGVRDLFFEDGTGRVVVRGDVDTLAAWGSSLRDYRIGHVPPFDVPAIALWAAEGPEPEPPGMAALGRRLPGLQSKCLAGSGHELFWDQPQAASREVWAFVDRVTAGA